MLANVLFDISKYPEYQALGREAAHHILYTVVNSAGMNGFVHGVRFYNGFAYYKFILIGWDILTLVAIFFMFKSIKKRRRNKKIKLALANGETIDLDAFESKKRKRRRKGKKEVVPLEEEIDESDDPVVEEISEENE